MSHEVETMAWTSEKPWHGLGLEVKSDLSPEAMMKAAKLNWDVTKEPLKTHAGVTVPDFFALQRSSDKRILDVVGKQYTPVQNVEAFEFFKEFVEAGKAKMETAGSLKNGRMVWGLANLGESFKLKGGDQVKGYLLVSSPHEQGKSLKIMFTAVRVVCNNTLTMALQGTYGSQVENCFRMAHRQKFDKSMQDLAKDTLGIAHSAFETFQEQATKLQSKRITKEQEAHYFRDLFMSDIKELRNAPLQEIVENYNKPASLAAQALAHAPGAQLQSAKGTAWGLLNSVTYVTDHMLGNTPDARLYKSWYGKNAALKTQALDLAMKI